MSADNLDGLSPDAQYLMKQLARTEEGRAALTQICIDELRKINWHLSGAMARCATAEAIAAAPAQQDRDAAA